MSLENESVEEELVQDVESVEEDSSLEQITSIEDLKELANGTHEPAESEQVETMEDRAQPEVEASEELVEYTPDFTYKVKDEVLEFDEALRAAVTTKEAEDRLRDLYTRAAGLDGYKTKNSELQSQLDELSPQLHRMVDGFKNIKSLRDDKDWDRLVQIIGWDKEDLLDYAESILEFQELPEEQRKVIESERKLRDRVEHLESQVGSFQDVDHERIIAEEKNQLRTILDSDEYSAGVQKLGEVGYDFEKDVIAVGTKMFEESGHKVYPEMAEVVKQAYEMRRPLIEALAAKSEEQHETKVNNKQPVQQVKVVEKQPTIPKVTGNNSNKINDRMTLERLKELSGQIPSGVA